MDPIQTIHIITEPTRFRLIQILFEHHYCVKALAKKLNISESAVSQHMRILKKHQVVYGVKKRYQMHYLVNKQLISSLFAEVLEQISQYSDDVEILCDCSCEFISECNCIKKDPKIWRDRNEK
jgi:predicted transcriptional regulator